MSCSVLSFSSSPTPSSSDHNPFSRKLNATELAALMAPSSSTSTDHHQFHYYDAVSAAPQYDDSFSCPPPPLHPPPPPAPPSPEAAKRPRGGGGGGGKKRRRKAKVCKNKEEVETQRMTHIAVERNRRKLMNEHLALLRSLMPPSFVQRGDQASIVAGAIEFVKELEHVLHSLQAQKLQLMTTAQTQHQNPNTTATTEQIATPFADFFCNHSTTTTTNKNLHHGHSSTKAILSTTSSSSSTYDDETMNSGTSTSNCSNGNGGGNVADVAVTLIESHANVRILWRRTREKTPLSKLVCGFDALGLGVLHFSVTTVHPFALYSVSAEVEEGCQLSSVDDIAAAVHHMLRLIVEQEESHHHPYIPLLPLITL